MFYVIFRIQYDALKSELDAFRSKNSDCQKLRDLERNLEEQREKYENLKENLQVKLKLLHEHRVRETTIDSLISFLLEE